MKAENHFSPTPTPTATPVRQVAFHAPRFLRNTLVQRAIYYVSTGAVCLAVLLFIAKSLNPPDSALMGADLVARIGRWDGHWKGAETTYTPKGQKVATAAVELSLWSTSANMQMARVTRKETSGSQATETWVTTVDGQGSITTRRAEEDSAASPLVGRLEDGRLFWYRRTSQATETRQSWIVGNTLHMQTVVVPADPSLEPTVSVGEFSRLPEGAR